MPTRTDTLRARIAAGFCERIADWNGFGRIILPSAAGVDAEEGSTPDPSTSAALMAQVSAPASVSIRRTIAWPHTPLLPLICARTIVDTQHLASIDLVDL